MPRHVASGPDLSRIFKAYDVRGVYPDELDEDMLTKIAYETGGKYFRATSLKELSDIYGEIDRMEKTEVKLPDIVSFKDAYAPWLLAA